MLQAPKAGNPLPAEIKMSEKMRAKKPARTVDFVPNRIPPNKLSVVKGLIFAGWGRTRAKRPKRKMPAVIQFAVLLGERFI